MNPLRVCADLLEPHRRRQAAAVVFVLSIIGWPATAITIARDEPQVVLGLSWLAITLTAVDIWVSTDVRKKQEEDESLV